MRGELTLGVDDLECIHKWYQMVEGFSVRLVRDILHRYKPIRVFDPFVGTGTTLVEARRMGIDSVGVDINPFLCFSSKVKTQTYEFRNVIEECDNVLKKVREKNEPSLKAPRIPRFETYYSPEVAKDLLALKESIGNVQDIKVRDLFLLIFCKISVLAGNVRRSPAPRFNKKGDKCSIFDTFEGLVEETCEDIQHVCYDQAQVDVIRGDSRDLNFLKDQPFDLILTSPPYCNNVDYVRHTQLELFWLDYVTDSDDLGRLRGAYLTSCEAMAHSSKDPKEIISHVKQVAEAIKIRTSRRWPRMVEQYFDGMKKHLRQVGNLLEPDGRAIYIVGNSWIKGVHVPTHRILADIARKEGYKVDIELLRERKGPRHHSNFLGEYALTMAKRP